MPVRARIFAALLVVSSGMWSMQPPTWVVTASEVNQSVVRLTYPVTVTNPFTGDTYDTEAVCSGFVIDERFGTVLTADHCLNASTAENLTVDGLKEVEVLWYDHKLDLAVLRVKDLHKPALAPRASDVKLGEEVAVLGFGYGLNSVLFGHMWVSNIRETFGDMEGEWLIVYGGYIGGQSGCPLFDLDGHVISIVQRSDGITGLSLPQDDLWNATKEYWQHPRVEPGEANPGTN